MFNQPASAAIYHGGESRDTTTTTMTHIWKNPPTSGKKIFNNSVNTWPIGIWFEAEKAERRRGFAWCVRFFKQHLIKKLLTSKQIIQGKKSGDLLDVLDFLNNTW